MPPTGHRTSVWPPLASACLRRRRSYRCTRRNLPYGSRVYGSSDPYSLIPARCGDGRHTCAAAWAAAESPFRPGGRAFRLREPLAQSETVSSCPSRHPSCHVGSQKRRARSPSVGTKPGRPSGRPGRASWVGRQAGSSASPSRMCRSAALACGIHSGATAAEQPLLLGAGDLVAVPVGAHAPELPLRKHVDQPSRHGRSPLPHRRSATSPRTRATDRRRPPSLGTAARRTTP